MCTISQALCCALGGCGESKRQVRFPWLLQPSWDGKHTHTIIVVIQGKGAHAPGEMQSSTGAGKGQYLKTFHKKKKSSFIPR